MWLFVSVELSPVPYLSTPSWDGRQPSESAVPLAVRCINSNLLQSVRAAADISTIILTRRGLAIEVTGTAWCLARKPLLNLCVPRSLHTLSRGNNLKGIQLRAKAVGSVWGVCILTPRSPHPSLFFRRLFWGASDSLPPSPAHILALRISPIVQPVKYCRPALSHRAVPFFEAFTAKLHCIGLTHRIRKQLLLIC